MSNHTKGPWTYFKSKYEDGECWDVFPSVVGEPNGVFIAEVYVEANAQLIARCPDFYQCLKDIADNCQGMDDLTYCVMAEKMLASLKGETDE